MIQESMTYVLVAVTVKTGDDVGSTGIGCNYRLHPNAACGIGCPGRVMADLADVSFSCRLIMASQNIGPVFRLVHMTDITG